MEQVVRLLEDTPVFSALDRWSLRYLAGLAERKEYKPNKWLFHESTPREWLGIVERGHVKIVRRQDDKRSCLAVVNRGGILSEYLLLDYLPHSVGGFTPDGAAVIQFSREAFERVRKDRPDLYYRIVARVSRIVNDRLRYATGRPAIEDALYPADKTTSLEMEDTWSILKGTKQPSQKGL
jgi:aspartate ammonia-lyase